jgi:catechol 2,3-dioxygenase-like lactoylglutathione lyase family enzyme
VTAELGFGSFNSTPDSWVDMAALKVEFVYAGIRVRDLARSLRFYRKLGFRISHRGKMRHGGLWVQMVFPGATQRVELNYYPRTNEYYEPFRRGTEFDHFGFWVSDVESLEQRLRQRRFPIVARIQAGKENIVYTQDPDGNWIEFFGPPPRRARRKP